MGVVLRVLGVVVAIACSIALVLMVMGLAHTGPLHNSMHGVGVGRVIAFTCGGIVAGIFMALTGTMPRKGKSQAVSPDQQRTQFIQTQQAQQQPQQGWQGQQQPQYPQNQPTQPNQPPYQSGDGQGGWQQ